MCFSLALSGASTCQVIRISLFNIAQHHICVILERDILEFLIIEIHTSVISRLLARLPHIALRIKRHDPVAESLALLYQLVLSLLPRLEWVSLTNCLKVENFDKQNQDVLRVFG
jgi:hypothetical protein